MRAGAVLSAQCNLESGVARRISPANKHCDERKTLNFFSQVYALTRQIPAGFVTTYGDLARALGTRDARRVGHALHANQDPTIPCHRVVTQTGRLAPHYAFGGSLEQYAKLKNEGVNFLDRAHVDLARHRFLPLNPLP